MDETKKDVFKTLVRNIASQQTRVDIGEAIRLARLEQGMSQAELADILDRRQAYVSDLENGKTEPSATTLIQLSIVLEKPIAYFVPGIWESRTTDKPKPDELTPNEAQLIQKIRQLEEGYKHHLAMRILNVIIDTDLEFEDYVDRISR
ncbi:MAG: helix-turn-helix transcriptional regulator [Chloroflexi bacterium]|nr:helix-turn-helix transcriptional regulator [Chloroflexota bacterium]